METVYLGIVIFLFMLAVFDLLVGVSNDAVNFMNSAVGAKVAKFRTIIIVAAAGVFLGAIMSNGRWISPDTVSSNLPISVFTKSCASCWR